MSAAPKPTADLSLEEKRALLAQLLREQASEPRHFPLSFAQERLWFLNQLDPDSSAYTLAAAVRLTGSLRLEPLEQALHAIILRHEILRTTFAMVDGQPVQVVAPAGPQGERAALELRVTDLRTLPAERREDRARQLAAEEAVLPFDLARGPLLRSTLFRLDEAEHVLLLTMHHIISDGWSMGVLIQEVAALYQALCDGRPAALPELPIQYADYAVWQRNWLQGSGVRSQESGVRSQETTVPLPPPAGGGTEGGRSQESDLGASQTQNSKLKTQNSPLEEQLDYWTRQLAGAPPILELPIDRPRPAQPTFRGATWPFQLAAPLTQAIRSLNRREGTTLFMTLLAAFDIVLARWSGQEDIVVGTPIANRHRGETEGLIGCFINSLVMRTDVSGDPAFRELLGRVREVAVGAYAHQDMPFEQLVEVLQPERDLSRTPLFQVIFTLQNAPMPALELPGLTLSPFGVEHNSVQFDLSLAITETADMLVGILEYKTDLFEPATIARMTDQLRTLLEHAVADPGRRLSELPLLTDAERHQLLVSWNATQVDYPLDACLHELFEVQAARTPDSVAVVSDARGQGSGVRGQETAPLPPPARGGTDLPPPAGGGTEGGRRTEGGTDLPPPAGGGTEGGRRTEGGIDLPPPAGGGTEGGRRTEGGSGWAWAALSPQSSVLSPEQLTYRELNDRANRLAHHLHALGVGPEVLVGICMERSVELLVGLLGILKAGGAYLPLDPSYPQERLVFMLEDSQAALLITTSDPSTRLGAGDRQPTTDDRPTTNDQRPMTTSDDRSAYGYDRSYPNDEQRRPTTTEQRRPTTTDVQPQSKIQNPKSKIVHLDADWPAIMALPAMPPSAVSAANLAYVIYTSGSTGTPKGVMNTHRGIVNRLLWMQDAYRLTAADRVLHKTPFSFDVSVWELFWPLLSGATLVLARPGGHQEPDYLARLIGVERISTLHFVPSLLQVFLEQPNLTMCGSLRRVISSGEALAPDLQERFFARLNAQLHNLYGPTEAAVDVTAWACERGSDRERVPIGRPIANTQTYVLDRQMQPAPIGAPGELYLGGVQLARGYLGRPDLTAERFVPNPFLKDEGKRMKDESLAFILHPSSFILYKTGDLARYRVDGAIEYLGRTDEQVKLRGFRIELGEIAAVLSQHPAVRAALVALREDAPGGRGLVAYLVTSDELQVTSSVDSLLVTRHSSLVTELRAFLQSRLPDYMIPAAFVELDALPLTPSGKLDRRALPAPDQARPQLEQPFVAPRFPAEEQLAAIWRELLHVDQISIYDDFFELGGHSLLLTRLASHIRQRFQVEMPLRVLFDARTIVDMTVAIATSQIEQEDPAAVDQLLEELQQFSPDEIKALLDEAQ